MPTALYASQMDHGSGIPPGTAPSAELLASLENLDVVSWVNNVLSPESDSVDAGKGSSQLTDLDRRVTHLVGVLDIASEETSALLERTIDDIARTAPRLTYDVHFMREGALTLHSALGAVQTRSGDAAGDAATTAALERLHFLDAVQRNMNAARAVLREAESWSTLEPEVTTLLEEHKYEKAAERLGEARGSMAVFANTPEFEARRSLMVSLQNQLEAALSSALVAAINSQDVEVCRNYFSIFSNIQRESEFRTYYYGSRRSGIVAQWQNTTLADCDASPGSPPTSNSLMLYAFLPDFYSNFSTMLNNERVSIGAIFPDPQPTLSSLLTSTLSALQPSLPQRLTAMVNYHGSSSLLALISAFKATEEFAVTVDKIMQKIGLSIATDTALSTVESSESMENALPRRSHSRRRSERMSISRRMAPHRASISGTALYSAPTPMLAAEWEQALFEPFVEFQAEYGALEQRLLEHGLREALATATRTTDRARLLKERAVDVFSMAEESLGRCAAFTHGYGAAELVGALDGVFRAFVDASTAELAGGRPPRTTASAVAAGQEDLYDLDYSADDWADIQGSLHMLEAARALQDRVLAFEGLLRGTLAQVANMFRAMRNDPANLHVAGTTRGEMELLAQSVLNSSQLHQLIDAAEVESPSQIRNAFLTPSVSPRHSLISAPHSSTTPLLTAARGALSDLARACQTALQVTILAPLRQHLSTYASSPLWAAPGDPRSGRADAHDLPVPVFSLSPSEPIQRVAEGLLNLPRLFEVYAADDALAFSLATLPFLDGALLRALFAHANAPPGGPDGDERTTRHGHRLSASVALKSPPVLAEPAALAPEAISSAWLSALGRALLVHFTGDVLPRIAALSVPGAAQLASDLGYLSNIVQALNVEYEPLERWRQAVEMDDGELMRRLTQSEGEEEVLRVVGRIRGFT